MRLLRAGQIMAAVALLRAMPRPSAQQVYAVLAGALAQHGLHFSALVAEVRVRHAAWWLLQGTPPMAEVGFVRGYADQAHFSRAFKRRTGWSPGAYRAGFRPAVAQARGPQGRQTARVPCRA